MTQPKYDVLAIGNAIVDVISGEDYKSMLVNKVDQQQYFIDM